MVAADVRLTTEIRGAVSRLWDGDVSGEVVVSGSAGTGKTRAIFEWLHWRCQHEQIRVLVLRKTLESLKASGLVTYQEQVLYGFDGRQSAMDGVRYYGGSGNKPAQFIYAGTGSVIIAGGMDNLAKVLSTEYDCIFINEVTELTLAQWEGLAARVDRPKVAHRPPSLLLGDCNPNVPTHWIKHRERDGKLKLWVSRHEDNPAMWDATAQRWTMAGRRYLARLDTMTGVGYKRMRLGQWVAAEGQVFDGWDESVHLIDRFPIPADWPRYWLIDFGFKHPYVHQWWAESPDGQLIRYREIYMTGRIVADHAAQALRLSANEPRPTEVITDHDAEDRATFERETGYRTRAAIKNVSAGIQAVQRRLRLQGNGKPGIVFMRKSLVEPDRELIEIGHPTCTEEEFPTYVWNTGGGRKAGEEPLKEFDHGMDSTRYVVAFKDLRNVSGPGATPQEIEQVLMGSYSDTEAYADDHLGEYEG